MNFYTFLSCFLIIYLTSSQLYNTSLYYLGESITSNPNFAEPLVPSGGNRSNKGNISGWNCTRTCQLLSSTQAYLIEYSYPVDQVIEMDSTNFFE